jgi:endoglucanase
MKFNLLKLLFFLPTVNSLIKGINWFGFETEYKNLMCTWTNDIEWNINKIKELDFNYIRLPFSLEFVNDGNWEEMDNFFNIAYEYDINVVLDFHRLHSTHQSFRPYDKHFTFDDFLDTWRIILDRYKSYTNLKGVDIFNEYQGNNVVEWNNLSRQIVSFIENQFPERFDYYVGGVRWGGNLYGVKLDDLEYNNRITYTIHKYWFSDGIDVEAWAATFDKKNHKLISVGEWGYKTDGSEFEKKFAIEFVDWLKENNIRDTFFWTWTYNSGDTGGILKDDCTTVDYEKVRLLHDLWYN